MREGEPYYQDERVTLYHGDCRELTAWLDADVLVTDPPYGIAWSRGANLRRNPNYGQANPGIQNDHDTTCRDEALTSWGAAKPALVFGSLAAEYPANWRRMLVFAKPVHSGLVGSRVPWRRNWEPIFMLGEWPDQTPTRSAIVTTQQVAASGYSGYATRAGHPHAKPVDTLEDLIDACPPGTIADPFAGAGSTLIAARNLGRRAVGVELEERYCELIAKRLSQGALDFGEVTA